MNIKLILIIAIVIIVALTNNRDSWIDQAQEKSERKFRNANSNIIDASKARQRKEQKEKARKQWLEETGKTEGPKNQEPKWYPSGWVFNEETQKWDPPDYLSSQSKEKWAWDVEKQIWIDREKESRKDRYHEFRKSQGKGPTYEEWKAAREAEQQDKSTN